MQAIVIDEPYTFIPPHRGNFWPTVFEWLLDWYLKREYGIVAHECRGLELLRASIAAGHGVLLAPNHCRLSDPLAMGFIARATGRHVYAMASWHLFKRGRIHAWVTRRMGAFSVYREGVDRTAISTAIEMLVAAERLLFLFPEGTVTRHNDLVNPLLEGVAVIARAGARKRAKASPPGKVVVHPVAIKYLFQGDVVAATAPTLAAIEARLSWRPRARPLYERIAAIGEALLSLKEVEYLGHAQTGDLHQRSCQLIERLLAPLEKKWLGAESSGHVVARVKKLRSAIVPDMAGGKIDAAERARRWVDLADLYLAQQLGFYPQDYIRSHPSAERFIETVERFEEDLTDRASIYGPLKVILQVGDAIEVPATKERQEGGGDPLLAAISTQLRAMLAELGKESPPRPELLAR